MASLLNLSGSALLNTAVVKQNVTLSFASATVNAVTTDGTKAVQSVTSSVQGLTYTYTSSDTSIASISGSTITIHKSGTVTITANFAGNDYYYPASASYSLVVSKANVTLSFTNATVNTTTSTSTMSVQTVNSSVQGLTITYSSNNSSVATISGTTITIVDVGSATITASFAGNDIYNSASASYSLVVAAAPIIYNFAYTGAVQSQVLQAGTYKLEVWGAQGGSYNTTAGGKGGYSAGTITIPTQTTVYVYVGGQGAGANPATALAGGFNGGGNGYGGASYYFGSGGGASDVRVGQDSLYARVIVAGGGGGVGSQSTSSSRRYAGGYGGGTSGGTGSQRSNSYRAGTGGSATAKGTSYNGSTADPTNYNADLAAFGAGGGRTSGTNRTAGGGGGWYGGGFSASGGGGGGSGYVYTSDSASNYPNGCLLNSDNYLTSTTMYAGNSSSVPTTDGTGTETGHAENGYARITKI